MKYFTKEWYMAVQKSSLEVCFRADERAAKLDETLYEEILEDKVKDARPFYEIAYSHIKHLKDEEVIKEKWIHDLYSLTGNETHKAAKAAYEYVLYQHPEALREVIRRQIEYQILYNRSFYPQEILDMVADERVFACEVATEEVICRMKEISRKNEQFVRETSKIVQAQRKALGGQVAGEILKYFDFHDVEVTGLHWEGSDLIIEMGEDCNFDEIRSMCMHDCEIKKMDEGIEGAIWLYEELDMDPDGRIRAGILLINTEAQGRIEEKLRQLELTARDITFIRAEGAEDHEIRNQKIHETLKRMGWI